MKKIVIICTLIGLLVSCGPTMSAVWSKPDYKQNEQNTIIVMGISNNLEVRQSLENEVIAGLHNQYPTKKFISGLSVFPANVDLSKIDKEKIETVIADQNPDAVLVLSVVSKYETQDFNTAVGFIPGYRYGRFGHYVYNTYNMVNTIGYYSTNQNYVLDASLFDAKDAKSKEEALVWKGQSEVTNPSDIRSGSKAYASNLVGYMIKNNVIK